MFKTYFRALLFFIALPCDAMEEQNQSSFNWNPAKDFQGHTFKKIQVSDYIHNIEIEAIMATNSTSNTNEFCRFSNIKEFGLSPSSELLWIRLSDKPIYKVYGLKLDYTRNWSRPIVSPYYSFESSTHLVDSSQEHIIILNSNNSLLLYSKQNRKLPITTFNLPKDVIVEALCFSKNQSKIGIKTIAGMHIYALKNKKNNKISIEPDGNPNL